VEPGTFLLANNGSLVTSVQDVVETGREGYRFLKVRGRELGSEDRL
jgi:diaminopimelate decarboxylase